MRQRGYVGEWGYVGDRMPGVDPFLKNLEISNLLTAAQWSALCREIAQAHTGPHQSWEETFADPWKRFRSPRELADWLIAQECITPWQADMLLAGKKAFFLGKYRLVDLIGTGGMGAVFKAVHGDLKRTVAIKVLTAEFTRNQDAVARFRQEIQAVAALDDPHIVAAYDAGFEKGCNYLVMEYVEGHDLGHFVKHHSPLSIDWSCECIRQAALGLQHAFEQGLVHRDIKPTNILVTTDSDGRPLTKILDLGLARFVTETPAFLANAGTLVPPNSTVRVDNQEPDDRSLTQIGQILGTPDYIAPEQARQTQDADIRSDIFSLGCTLFRLLTGELPFGGETVLEKLDARETNDARHVREFRKEVPEGLDAVVARMLARRPEDRYQTPRTVALALAPFCKKSGKTPRPIPARDVPPSPPLARTGEADSRLEQILMALATEAAEQPVARPAIESGLPRASPRVVLAISIAIIAGMIAWFVWQRESVATVAIDWPLKEREGGTLTVRGSPTKLPPQQKFSISGDAGHWKLQLERDGYEPIREDRYVKRGETSEFTPRWRATPATARRDALAILERGVAEASQAEVLSASAGHTRKELQSFVRQHWGTREAATAQEWLSKLRWPLDLLVGAAVPPEEREQFTRFSDKSAGATLVGVIGVSRLKFWNQVTAVATSGDGRLVAGAALDGTVQIFDLTDGRCLATYVPSVMPTDLVFSPDEHTLAIAGSSEPVVLWIPLTSSVAATFSGTAAPIAFSADGTLIAGRAARQEIALWDAKTGELKRTMQGHATGDLLGMSFSHNGKMLASFGSDKSVVLWDVASGQERRRLADAQHPQFSPDDAYLATGTVFSHLVLWDTRTGETELKFEDGGYPLAFLSGGRAIVSRRQGRAILWDLNVGEEIRTIIEVPDLTAVSPDGKWLAGGDAAIGELRLWNLESVGSPRVINTFGPITSLTFTADSKTVVTGSRSGAVQIWSTESGQERVVNPVLLGPADLSPDGRRLAARQADRVELIDVTASAAAGFAHRELASGVADLDVLAFSPNGKWLAGFGGWGFFRTSLRLWDVDAEREVELADQSSGAVRSLAFSARYELLAVAGESRLVTVWDLSERKLQYDLNDFTDRVTALAFHPDGKRLAFACLDHTVVLCDLKVDLKGDLKVEKKQSFASPKTVCRQLAFSGDGKFLAAPADDRIVIWKTATGKIAAELAVEEGVPLSLAWHPADQALAATGNSGRLWMWKDPGARRYRDEADQTIVVGPPGGIVHRVLWSPDGRHVLTVNGNGTLLVLRLIPQQSP